MQMSHDEVLTLIDTRTNYPREMTDVATGIFRHGDHPDEPLVLVVDSRLWFGQMNVGRVIYSLNVERAKQLVEDLAGALDALGEG